MISRKSSFSFLFSSSFIIHTSSFLPPLVNACPYPPVFMGERNKGNEHDRGGR